MQNGSQYVPPHLRKEKELETARAKWDAQRKKQKKEEDQEESRRKLQPARKPFDNGVRLTGSCMEKNAVLRGPLSTNGSHPYKDVPYESGDHTCSRTEEDTSSIPPDPRTFNQFEGQEDGRKEEEEGDNDVSYVPPSSL